jgi:hypothetical protein
MFELVKWYMDVVAEDGSALFAYSARVRWGAVRVSVASLCQRSAAGVVREASTLRPGRSPVLGAGRLVWKCAPIGVQGVRELPAIIRPERSDAAIGAGHDQFQRQIFGEL